MDSNSSRQDEGPNETSMNKGCPKFMKPSTRRRHVYSIQKFQEKLKESGFAETDIAMESQFNKYEEEITWIPHDLVSRKLDGKLFNGWSRIGPLMTSNDVTSTFIDSNVFKEIRVCKQILHQVEEEYYETVREQANLFEIIGKGPFSCSRAMKIANLDSMLGFSLTEPKNQSGNPLVGPNDLFYFADVCGGPGGFVEYVLFKKKWEAKGFGLTLKGHLDYKTDDFLAAETASFEAYYGPAKDGNIYNPDNVAGYFRLIQDSTSKNGVHLMMADGGVPANKEEYMQEIVCGQVLLSQCLIAIGVVRTGGHFVCRVFDVYTRLTVGLIYLMQLAFEAVAIHKPNTSRPTESERYLICKWKKEGTEALQAYLENCHRLMWDSSIKQQKGTLVEVVPLSILTTANMRFCKYISESNNSLGTKLIQSFKNIMHYVLHPTLRNQSEKLEARRKSLELWGIPMAIHKPLQLLSTDNMFSEILGPYPASFVRNPERELTPDTLATSIISPHDWTFVVVEGQKGNNIRGFFLGMGKDKVYRYDGHFWILCNFGTDEKLHLASKTLIYGEVVEEIHGKISTQSVFKAFHIIDAVMVGGQDIRNLHYIHRHKVCWKFAKAMNRHVRGIMPVRVKDPIRMENVDDLFQRLSRRVLRSHGIGSKLVCPIDHTDETSPVFQPAGFLFIKITKDPWQMAVERETKRKFWFNMSSGQVSYVIPEEAIANFESTMNNRLIWSWGRQTKLVGPRFEVNDPRGFQLSKERVHTFSLINHILFSLNYLPQVVVSPKTDYQDVERQMTLMFAETVQEDTTIIQKRTESTVDEDPFNQQVLNLVPLTHNLTPENVDNWLESILCPTDNTPVVQSCRIEATGLLPEFQWPFLPAPCLEDYLETVENHEVQSIICSPSSITDIQSDENVVQEETVSSAIVTSPTDTDVNIDTLNNDQAQGSSSQLVACQIEGDLDLLQVGPRRSNRNSTTAFLSASSSFRQRKGTARPRGCKGPQKPTNRNSEPCICPKCNTSFSRYHGLKRHLKTKHHIKGKAWTAIETDILNPANQ